jgi:methyltransferase
LPEIAIIFTILNAMVLFIRISAENRALAASREITARAAP